MITYARVHGGAYLVTDLPTGKTVLVQTDWDYPGIAGTFGWNIRDCQVLNAGYYGVVCEHRGTDGTVDCPDCGLTAGTFITSAAEYLAGHQGAEADDPGYFGGAA